MVRRRLLVAFGVAVPAILAFMGMQLRVPAAPAASSGTKAEIRFVDVGQGDGVVMRIGNNLIISDVGEHNLEAVKGAEREGRLGSRGLDDVLRGKPVVGAAVSAARACQRHCVGDTASR